MARIHDLFIVELAEVIKGYGNNPDVEDPFCLSEFYRFYELPNIAVSKENFEKMRPVEKEEYKVQFPDKDHVWIDGKQYISLRRFGEAVKEARTEIVRCKDCKHRDKYGCCKYWKGLAMADIPIATDDNDFCSYAEQKGEQDDR